MLSVAREAWEGGGLHGARRGVVLHRGRESGSRVGHPIANAGELRARGVEQDRQGIGAETVNWEVMDDCEK